MSVLDITQDEYYVLYRLLNLTDSEAIVVVSFKSLSAPARREIYLALKHVLKVQKILVDVATIRSEVVIGHPDREEPLRSSGCLNMPSRIPGGQIHCGSISLTQFGSFSPWS